jgi:hypothetical protein
MASKQHARAKTQAELQSMDWEGVCEWLRVLDISPHIIDKVREEKVPGDQLCAMSVDELKQDLGMSALQAKRVIISIVQ